MLSDPDNPDKSLPTASTNKSRLFMPFDSDDPDHPDPDKKVIKSKHHALCSPYSTYVRTY